MKKTLVFLILISASFAAVPAFADLQHLYCHSVETPPSFQMESVLVDNTHLDQVYFVTSAPNGDPLSTDVGAITGDAVSGGVSFKLGDQSISLPTDLTERKEKPISGTVDLSGKSITVACFIN